MHAGGTRVRRYGLDVLSEAELPSTIPLFEGPSSLPGYLTLPDQHTPEFLALAKRHPELARILERHGLVGTPRHEADHHAARRSSNEDHPGSIGGSVPFDVASAHSSSPSPSSDSASAAAINIGTITTTRRSAAMLGADSATASVIPAASRVKLPAFVEYHMPLPPSATTDTQQRYTDMSSTLMPQPHRGHHSHGADASATGENSLDLSDAHLVQFADAQPLCTLPAVFGAVRPAGALRDTPRGMAGPRHQGYDASARMSDQHAGLHLNGDHQDWSHSLRHTPRAFNSKATHSVTPRQANHHSDQEYGQPHDTGIVHAARHEPRQHGDDPSGCSTPRHYATGDTEADQSCAPSEFDTLQAGSSDQGRIVPGRAAFKWFSRHLEQMQQQQPFADGGHTASDGSRSGQHEISSDHSCSDGDGHAYMEPRTSLIGELHRGREHSIRSTEYELPARQPRAQRLADVVQHAVQLEDASVQQPSRRLALQRELRALQQQAPDESSSPANGQPDQSVEDHRRTSLAIHHGQQQHSVYSTPGAPYQPASAGVTSSPRFDADTSRHVPRKLAQTKVDPNVVTVWEVVPADVSASAVLPSSSPSASSTEPISVRLTLGALHSHTTAAVRTTDAEAGSSFRVRQLEPRASLIDDARRHAMTDYQQAETGGRQAGHTADPISTSDAFTLGASMASAPVSARGTDDLDRDPSLIGVRARLRKDWGAAVPAPAVRSRLENAFLMTDRKLTSMLQSTHSGSARPDRMTPNAIKDHHQRAPEASHAEAEMNIPAVMTSAPALDHDYTTALPALSPRERLHQWGPTVETAGSRAVSTIDGTGLLEVNRNVLTPRKSAQHDKFANDLQPASASTETGVGVGLDSAVPVLSAFNQTAAKRTLTLDHRSRMRTDPHEPDLDGLLVASAAPQQNDDGDFDMLHVNRRRSTLHPPEYLMMSPRDLPSLALEALGQLQAQRLMRAATAALNMPTFVPSLYEHRSSAAATAASGSCLDPIETVKLPPLTNRNSSPRSDGRSAVSVPFASTAVEDNKHGCEVVDNAAASASASSDAVTVVLLPPLQFSPAVKRPTSSARNAGMNLQQPTTSPRLVPLITVNSQPQAEILTVQLLQRSHIGAGSHANGFTTQGSHIAQVSRAPQDSPKAALPVVRPPVYAAEGGLKPLPAVPRLVKAALKGNLR